jgi:hypothetical protein
MRNIKHGLVVHLGASSSLARQGRRVVPWLAAAPMELDETHDMMALP